MWGCLLFFLNHDSSNPQNPIHIKNCRNAKEYYHLSLNHPTNKVQEFKNQTERASITNQKQEWVAIELLSVLFFNNPKQKT